MSDNKKLSLIHLAWPIFVEMLLLMLMGNMDVFMLSQYSDSAVNSVGVANQFVMFAIVMFGFVSTGAAVIIAQYLGAEKFGDARKVAGVALCCSLAFGCIVSFVFLFFHGNILSLMDLAYYVRQPAERYLVIVGSFIFMQAMLTSVNTILRSYRHTRDTMVITVTMNIINIVGNAVVIFGVFGFSVTGFLGIATTTGVAITTVISRSLALCLALFILFRRVGNPFKGISIKKFPFQYVKKIFSIGIPAAGENLSYSGYQTFLTMLITGMGAAAISTRIYSRSLNVFMFLITVSIAQAGQIIIGHLMGAKKIDEIYKKCFRFLKLSIFSSVVVALLFFTFSRQLLGIFTDNPDVIETGRQVMFVFIFLEIGRACNVIIIGSLRAVGDVKFPVIVGIFSMWGIGALMGFVLGVVLGFGVVGIIIATAMDECTRGIIMLFRWRSKKWQKYRITDD
ncbi:MAG: MATE family efflux transporter [Defluviitaleaceae bacterium]|nr:MATE family efflux transporter [Defluviitaleaceae bacterium]